MIKVSFKKYPDEKWKLPFDDFLNQLPPPVHNFTFVKDKDTNNFYIGFGRSIIDKNEINRLPIDKIYNDVFEYFPIEKKFRNLTGFVCENRPIERQGSSMIIRRNLGDNNNSKNLVVFGGFTTIDTQPEELLKIHSFCLKTQKWSLIEFSNKPQIKGSISGHSYLYHNKKDSTYLFSGFHSDNNCDNKIRVCNFKEKKWEFIESNIVTPRYFHSVNWIDDSQQEFVCFGGCFQGRFLNDCFIFNVKNRVWRELKTFGSLPFPRRSHASIVYKNKLYIHGGIEFSTKITKWGNISSMNDFYVLNLANSFWTRIKPVFGIPKMCAHKFGIYFYRNQVRLFSFGGFEWFKNVVGNNTVDSIAESNNHIYELLLETIPIVKCTKKYFDVIISTES